MVRIGAIRSSRRGEMAGPVRPVLRTALVLACLGSLMAPAVAQAPATPPAAAQPTPVEAPTAAPAPAQAQAPTQAPAPAQAQAPTPTPAPAQPAPGAPAAPAVPPPPTMHGAPQTVFTGEGIVMSPVPVLSKSGSSSWDEGYDSIVGSLKAIQVEMDKLGLTQAGQVFVVYTQSDDAGFEYEAQIPFSGATTGKPGNNVRLAASFNGKALKFMHKGSFADMDDTYEQIANYLDARSVTALDFYIEQYHTDPRTTPPDQLLLDILVPVR